MPLSDRAHEPAAPLSSAGHELHRRFAEAVDDNLDLPVALAALRDALRADLSDDEKRWLALDADLVLGLDLHAVWQRSVGHEGNAPSPHVQELLAARDRARAASDFATADAIRETLRGLGHEVADSRRRNSSV
jgi:cysteinyl-tRNA synthetase